MIPKMLHIFLKPSKKMLWILNFLHILSMCVVLFFPIHFILKIILIIIIIAYYFYERQKLNHYKLLQISQSGRASVLTQKGEWFLIQIAPETFCNKNVVILNFKYLDEKVKNKKKWQYLTSQSIVLTRDIFKSDDEFRHLRIILKHAF